MDNEIKAVLLLTKEECEFVMHLLHVHMVERIELTDKPQFDFVEEIYHNIKRELKSSVERAKAD